MRAPTKPRRVGKIDRQELEAGTSPSCGSPGFWLFWFFDRWWGWWWCTLEGDERSFVCCGDFLNSPRKFWISIRTPARRPYQDVSHPQSSLTGSTKRRMAPATYQEPIDSDSRYLLRTTHWQLILRSILGLLLVNTDRKRVLASMLPHGPNARDSSRTLKWAKLPFFVKSK